MRAQRYFRVLVLVLVLPAIAGIAHNGTSVAVRTHALQFGTEAHPRPVTVADSIRMSHLADGETVLFSPDGSRFVATIRRGNLESNTNDYSLLLWKTAEIFESSEPDVLVTLSSSSNREAICQVKWREDNETVAFLGESPGEQRQLYTFNVRTRILRRVITHPSNLVSYAMSADANAIAFTAQSPTRSVWNEATVRNGLVVSTQWLNDLIAGTQGSWLDGAGGLFTQTPAGVHEYSLKDRLDPWTDTLLSPDGRFVIVRTNPSNIPDEWAGYTNSLIHQMATTELKPGEYSELRQYTLIDTARQTSTPLLNAPIGIGGSEAAWSIDGRSVVLSNVYLPLEGNPEKGQLRNTTTFIVEVNIESGNISEISRERLSGLSWSRETGVLSFNSVANNSENAETVSFAKRQGRWERISGASRPNRLPAVKLEQDMNNPPKLYAIRPVTGQKVLLLDPNPQFHELFFAKVQAVDWTTSTGHQVRGGLYFPVHYVAGTRYPAVIQTHGFRSDRFWIDGPWATGFAAQSLAGKDVVVLQLDEDTSQINTTAEVDREVLAIESAASYLIARGLADPERIGVLGFSRTCLFVMSALVRSKIHFAAASIADGVDAGYFQYLAFSNAVPDWAKFLEGDIGARPFGAGLKEWFERSPGFKADEIKTPVRILAPDNGALLSEWQWFASLRRLNKPIEMIYLQDGSHILEKPLQRMVSQQGNVDWFCFWLKREESPDSSKAEQYARWHELRNLGP